MFQSSGLTILSIHACLLCSSMPMNTTLFSFTWKAFEIFKYALFPRFSYWLSMSIAFLREHGSPPVADWANCSEVPLDLCLLSLNLPSSLGVLLWGHSHLTYFIDFIRHFLILGTWFLHETLACSLGLVNNISLLHSLRNTIQVGGVTVIIKMDRSSISNKLLLQRMLFIAIQCRCVWWNLKVPICSIGSKQLLQLS